MTEKAMKRLWEPDAYLAIHPDTNSHRDRELESGPILDGSSDRRGGAVIEFVNRYRTVIWDYIEKLLDTGQAFEPGKKSGPV
jgi:hypothetical protein